MVQENLSIEQATAVFIKSMANLVWILALAIITGAYLTISGYEISSTLVEAIRSIMISSLWIILLLRLFSLIDKWLEDYQSNKATEAKYRER